MHVILSAIGERVKKKFNNTLSIFFDSYIGRKEGNVLFNEALNTFCLRLYGTRHLVMDHSDND